ncbi:dipeptidase PepE [Klebsiella pneumoniae]|nr:dipeptidase PepE [Klebsiella pneumoniae]
MELLLLSNSTLPGKAWLEHALPLIAGQVKGRRKAVFIPFAGVTQSWDDYTAKVAAVMAPMAVSVTGIHSVDDPIAAIESTEMVIVGGGNTFQVDPQGFDALGLFPLQINPHFTNALPTGHQGETREQRIRELLVVAPELTVIGLPEGNWIQVTDGHATLGGPNPTLLFKAGEEAITLPAGHRF